MAGFCGVNKVFEMCLLYFLGFVLFLFCELRLTSSSCE